MWFSLLPRPINIAPNPSHAHGDRKLMVKRCSGIISFAVFPHIWITHRNNRNIRYCKPHPLHRDDVCAIHSSARCVVRIIILMKIVLKLFVRFFVHSLLPRALYSVGMFPRNFYVIPLDIKYGTYILYMLNNSK